MANVTRKVAFEIVAAMLAEHMDALEPYCANYDVTPEDVAARIGKDAEQAAKVRKAKPSAETLKNAAIKNDIITELETRGGEFTAKQLAELMTDPEGMPMSARKVGVLLGHLAREGRIAKSPEAWSSPHYGKVGTEFKKKPVKQRRKSDQTDN